MSDDNSLTCIVVKPNLMPEKKSYSTFNAILSDLKINKKTFETALFNNAEHPYEGIGIILHDQDESEKRKQNILGVKGNFVVIGMERLEPGTKSNMHMFTSLSDEQYSLCLKSLLRAQLFRL